MTTTTYAAPDLMGANHLGLKAANGKLAMLAQKPKPGQTMATFDDDRYVGEPKLDGWRLLIHVTEDGVEIWTRNGKRHDGSLPTIEAELRENLPPGTWIDTEAVALHVVDGKVTTSSSKVGKILGSNPAKAQAMEDQITLMAFDLLAHGGIDATKVPFGQRRELLEQIFAGAEWKRTTLVPQLRPTEASYDALLAHGFEGMMVKDRKARYAPDARRQIKVKPELELDAILTGFTDGKDGFKGLIGAVTFGALDADGNLVELGKCSGMDMKVREDMTKNPGKYVGQPAEIKYLERHPTGGFRNPNFKRLRGGELTVADCTLEKIG